MQVLTYQVNPYLYVGNNDQVGSSVIKLHVLDKEGESKKTIKDKDDPIDVFVNTDKLDGDTYYEDMTESASDSGVYLSYVDTNQTAGGFMFEIKLTSLKKCEVFCKYGSFPDIDNYDMYVKTKGKSRIIDQDPLDLRVTFKQQLVKITLSPGRKEDGDGTLKKPLVVTASCEGNTLFCYL